LFLRSHGAADIVTIDAEGFNAEGFIAIKGRAKRFAKIGGKMISLAAVGGAGRGTLLRQPGFSQALFVYRRVFRSAKREHTPEIGNPQCRIDLAQACHRRRTWRRRFVGEKPNRGTQGHLAPLAR